MSQANTAAKVPASTGGPLSDRDGKAAFLPVYARTGVMIESGEGAWLAAHDGKRYLDFSSGVAVVNLGHRHPAVLAATQQQLNKIWHTSNHFWHEPMIGLAARLQKRFERSKLFLCNSGAEATEAIIKYARKATGRSGIVALQESFHGRTCGALSVTGQAAKRDIFYPLLPDVSFVEPNNEAALRQAVNRKTGLIILEMIQGEGGVRPLDAEFVAEARKVASDAGALLAIDEIQCGVGRTGSFFGFEQLNVRPDLISMAKALSNGLPIGAMLVADEVAGAFGPGDHATTFGGNAVVCAAACATLDALTDNVLANCRRQGARLREALSSFQRVREVRGRGLLIGCEIDGEADQVLKECRERGLIATKAAQNVLRLLPPLIVGDQEVDKGLAILEAVLAR